MLRHPFESLPPVYPGAAPHAPVALVTEATSRKSFAAAPTAIGSLGVQDLRPDHAEKTTLGYVTVPLLAGGSGSTSRTPAPARARANNRTQARRRAPTGMGHCGRSRVAPERAGWPENLGRSEDLPQADYATGGSAACRGPIDPLPPKGTRSRARCPPPTQGIPEQVPGLKWGPVRIVQESDLLLVEKALAAHLWQPQPPAQGCTLAVAYCEHYVTRATITA